MAVLAGLAVAGGMIFPVAEAEAQAYGGYTYTQRVCQEYGQQPRYYNVRDGQAAYNGGNSDSGWLIVLQRGGGIPARYVAVSEDIALSGTTLGSGTHIGDGTNFILVEDAQYYRPTPYYPLNPWTLNSIIGRFVKVANNGDDSDYVRGLSDDTPPRPRNRYNYIPGVPGGQYIRWAHMAWCR